MNILRTLSLGLVAAVSVAAMADVPTAKPTFIQPTFNFSPEGNHSVTVKVSVYAAGTFVVDLWRSETDPGYKYTVPTGDKVASADMVNTGSYGQIEITDNTLTAEDLGKTMYYFGRLRYQGENEGTWSNSATSVVCAVQPKTVADAVYTYVPGDSPYVSVTGTLPTTDYSGNVVFADQNIKLTQVVFFRDNAEVGVIKATSGTPLVPGEAFTWHDTANLEQSKLYAYSIRVDCEYGQGRTTYSENVWVGEDAPFKVGDLAAESNGKTVKLTWTAPERGANKGLFYPESVSYAVYQCDPLYGEYDEDKKLVSEEGLKDCALEVDMSDLEEPSQFSFIVYAQNEIGRSNGADVLAVAGPAYVLPFEEKFNAAGPEEEFAVGPSKIWEETFDSEDGAHGMWMSNGGIGMINPMGYDADNYFFGMDQSADDAWNDYNIYDGMRLFLFNPSLEGINYDYSSYLVDFTEAEVPVLTFQLFRLADDVYTHKMSAGFKASDAEAPVLPFSEAVGGGVDANGWAPVTVSLEEAVGKTAAIVFRATSAESSQVCSAIDDIRIENYPALKGLEGVFDHDNQKLTLTWTAPAGDDIEIECYTLTGLDELSGSLELPNDIERDATSVEIALTDEQMAALKEAGKAAFQLAVEYPNKYPDYGNVTTKTAVEVPVSWTGINSVLDGAQEVIYLNLQGVPVTNPAAGETYIEVKNGSTRKVVL